MRLAVRLFVTALLATTTAFSAHAAEMLVASGSYVGDDDSNRAITGIGFAPDVVIIKASNGEPAVVRTDNMPSDDAKPLGQAVGFTSVFRSFDADGFSVRNDPEVNEGGVTYHWIAYKSAADRMVIGSYVGDLLGNRLINVGFSPDYVMVWTDGAQPAVQRFAAQTGDASLTFQGDGPLTNLITTFQGNGFRVGSSAAVNGLLATYYYVAWNATAGAIATASYLGDATDDRVISGAGLESDGLFIARREAGVVPVLRTASVAGDQTLPLSPQPVFPDGIQALLSDGFEVGTDPRVNAVGTFYWVGFENPPDTDLSITCTADQPVAQEGDSLIYTVTLTNSGILDTPGIEVTQALPPGFTYGFTLHSQGSYSPGQSRWQVGLVPAGGSAWLQTRGVIDPGTAGSTLVQHAMVTASGLPEGLPGDEADTTLVRIPLAELQMTLTIPDMTPTQSERMAPTMRVHNFGPDSGIAVTARMLPSGFTYVTDQPSHGSFDRPSGVWTIGDMAPGDSATLVLGATIDAGGAGTTLTPAARILAPLAGNTANDADSVDVLVQPDGTRVVTGSYVGDGAAARAVSGVGFQPDLVIVKAASAAAISVARTRSMVGDAAKELGAATALVTGRILSVGADGFTVGAHVSVNQPGVTYYWTAFLETPGQMRVGFYTGTGADNQNLIGLGLAPDYMIIMSSGANSAVQRYAAQTGDATLYFQGVGELTDRIQAFNPDGFQVGTGPQVNTAGTIYYCVAWSDIATLSGGDSHTGNGVDDRDLEDLGFRPHHLFVTRREAGVPTVMRNRSIPGNLTLPATAAVGFSNGIQGLFPSGFQVGTDASVNASGNTYYSAGFRDVNGADIGIAATVSDATPDRVDTLSLVLTATNYGYQAATSIVARQNLPGGLIYQGSAATQGGYDPGTGLWSIGALANGASATLVVTATIDAGSVTGVMHHAGYVLGSTSGDLFADDDADSVAIDVRDADLVLDVTADDLTPVAGENVVFSVRLDHPGPDDASGVSVQATLPAGLTFQSSLASQGAYDPGTGVWTVGSIPVGGFATVAIVATVSAAPGTSVGLAASVLDFDQIDPASGNDADSVSVDIHAPGFRLVTGSYVGDDATARAITGVGFQPDLLVIKSSIATSAVARTRTMTGDAAKALGVASAPATGRVRSLDRDGFTVGSDSTVNRTGVTYYWTAFLETSGQMTVGAYTGNGADNRSVTGFGLTPVHAVVLGANAQLPVQRYSGETGDASLSFLGGPEATNRIQRFDPDGFQLGNAAEVNALGVVYHFVAWSAVPALIGGSSYAGNGADDRDLFDPAFRPDHLWITRREGGSPTVARNRSMPGDLTLPATVAPAFTNGVQQLFAGGFEVGSATGVNASGGTYLVTAFRDMSGADLGLGVTTSERLPEVGETFTLVCTVTNHGFEDAAGVGVAEILPAGLELVAATPTQGTYDSGSGAWSVGTLVNGDAAKLVLDVRPLPAAAGATLWTVARLVSSTPADPFGDNDADSTSIHVPLADLALTHEADDLTPVAGESVVFTVRIVNRGPDSAAVVVVSSSMPPEIAHLSSTASQGSYDPPSGVWTVGPIGPGGSANLYITGAPLIGAGASATVVARIVQSDPSDSSLADHADTTVIDVRPTGFQIVTGSYVGTGAARQISGVGFQPDLLIVKGVNGAAAMARTKYMATDGAKELGASTAITAGAITALDRDGFMLGNHASVNQSGVTYYWSAFLETPGQMKVGSYTGTGVDNRSITGVGFLPGYGMVMGSGASSAMQRFAGESGDGSLAFQTGAELTNRIQRFDPDGFQLGTHASVNANGTTYYYVVWNSTFARAKTGLYLGNGVDNRSVIGWGLRPKHLMIKRLDSSPAMQRSASMPGDFTLPTGPGLGLTNAIQALISDGVQLGTDASVNSNSQVYFWMAFGDLPSLDLAIAQTVSDSTPNEGDAPVITLNLKNLGPENATGVIVTHDLPAGLTYQAHVPSIGVYDPGTGVWTIGSVVSGDSATLAITATVDAGTGGSTLKHVAEIAALDQTDSQDSNNETSLAIRIQSADLKVRVGVDRQSPQEGDTVAITVSAINRGPDAATTVSVGNLLPPGLLYLADTPDRGTYDSPSGTWSIGTLALGDSVALRLDALVAAGTGGTTLTHHSSVTSVDQADPAPGNESDSVSVYVAQAPGIQFAAVQDSSPARPGQSHVRLLSLTLLNSSTEARTLQQLVFRNRSSGAGTPAQLDLELGSLALHKDQGDGVFDPATDSLVHVAPADSGKVRFDGLSVNVPSGSLVQLHLGLDVPLGACDADRLDLVIEDAACVVFDQGVTLLNAWPVDPSGLVVVDGMSRAQLAVAPLPSSTVAAGTQRNLVLDVVIPPNGYLPDILNGIHLDNLGTAVPGVDITRIDVWGDGTDGEFDAGAPDDFPLGAATWTGSRWSLTGLSIPIPLQGRRLFASVDVSASATVGRTIALSLGGPSSSGFELASGNDGPVDSAAATPHPFTIGPGLSRIGLTASQTSRYLLPGAAAGEVLRLRLVNQAAQAETLSSLILSQATTGPGTPTQLDSDWRPLTLVMEGQPVGITSFVAGRAWFSGLAIALAPGDTVNGTVEGAASLAARDGDILDLEIAAASDVVFKRPVLLEASWPVDPVGTFPVDGMSAAQIQVGQQSPPQVLTGSTRNLALEVVIPNNGYEADALEFLMVRNRGDAQPGVDVSRVEAWADDGDGVFEPGPSGDVALGTMPLTGGAWALGKFSTPIPPLGLRVFFSCDIADDAPQNRTVRLYLPSGPITGIGMASANDGPRDLAIENPVLMTISANDRITLTTQGVAPGTVAPGDTGVVLLHLIVGNSYSDSTKTLNALSLANLTTGASSLPSVLDREIQSLELRSGTPSGPVLGRSFFTGGRATFAGMSFAIPPQQSRALFVVAEVALADAADGDVIRASVPDEGSLLFAGSTEVSARFPLQSGAAWQIDGMIARQIETMATPDTTLGPGEGPVVAFDWVVPPNGYATDILEAVRLINTGSAGAPDLSDLHLWKDGGNGRFDGGQEDDVDLGSLVFASGRWSSQALSEPIGAAGARLFASVMTSADPSDSATVRFAIPVNGIGVASPNDGPRDLPVLHGHGILLSRSRLLASIELAPAASVVGDTLTARMTVRNTGDLGIYGVVPSALSWSGDGAIVPIGGVAPPFINLEPDSSGVFTWMFLADSTGAVQLTGSAAGTELTTGFVHRSLTVGTLAHSIYSPAQAIELYPAESMPFSVHRGQTQVVPISLTLSHPGGPEVSDVLFQRLSIRLEDDLGNGVVPESLLSRAALNEGATVFAELTTLPGSGASFDLTLAEPLRLQSGGAVSSQVTLSLALDILDSTRVSSFRIAIVDSGALTAIDAINGAEVAVQLPAPQSYPILTGLARIVAGGTHLEVAGVADTARRAGRGQDDVELLRLVVDNPGPTSLGPDLRLAGFEVSVVDSTGAVLAGALSKFRRLELSTSGQVLVDRVLTAADSGTVSLLLSPLLTLPINTPVPLRIAAEIAPSATLGPVRLRISRPESFSVLNASTGAPVPALFATQPIDGPLVTVEARAESLLASRIPASSSTVSIGATDVTAMTVVLSHPDLAGTAAIVCASLTIRCRDQLGRPVAPNSLVHRAQVVLGGIEVGVATDPGSSGGEFTIPLQGVVLEAGQRISLDLEWSVEASAFAGFYELSIAADGIPASDMNLGTPVEVLPDSGAEFPLSSGLFELIAPARELVAGFEDAMPAALAADGRAVPVGRLTLQNRAAAGEIRVDGLAWVAGDRNLSPTALGGVASRLEAWVMDTLWAAVDLDPASVSDTLTGSSVLSLLPGPATVIEMRIVPREQGAGTTFRLGCHREGISVVQPASPLLRVSVISEEGQSFPFWTGTGSLNPRSLEESYSNFPNPFAAGRQATTFVYYLSGEARITLNIWTAVGDKVATVLSGAERPAGLHQADHWDGRNGSGRTVVNGVYLAELIAQYADGTSQRILRKVAVAR